MLLLLKVKPPHPCPPNNPHCGDVKPELPIDGWIWLMIIVALIFGDVVIKNYKKHEFSKN